MGSQMSEKQVKESQSLVAPPLFAQEGLKGARQYLSTSALVTLLPAPARALYLTFNAPYAHTAGHYSNPDNSLDLVIDSRSSHHVTTNLATLARHEPYTSSNHVLIGDGTSLSIVNIGSITLTSLPTLLLFTNVSHVPTMSKNLISVFAHCADNPINVLFFLLFLSGAGSSHGGHSGL